MVRPQNGMMERRGGGRGRGQRGGRQFSRGQGGIQKPPPLMSRPLPPPPGIRRPPMGHHRGRGMGPPPMGMGHPGRMGPPGGMIPDGPHHGRMGPPPPMVHHGRMGPPVPHRGRGRGMGPPMGGMMRGRGRGVMRGAPMPPPMGPPFPGPPGMMVPHRGRGRGRGRGTMRGGRGAAVNRRVKEKPPQKKNLQHCEYGLTRSQSSLNEMNKPWITEAMKNEIMKKHKLHQKAKKSKSKEDWDAFKEQRNKVTTMIREAKLEYIGAHPEEDVEKILAEAANQGNKKGDEESNREASATSEAKEDKADAALDGQGAEAEHMEEVVDTPSEAEPAKAELTEAESPEAPATSEANGDTVEALEPAEAV